jgi:hypothetical protein
MMRILQINLHAEENTGDLSTAEKQKRGKSIYVIAKKNHVYFLI